MKKKTATKLAKSKASKSDKSKSAPPTPVQEALQLTWLLKGNLKNAQLSYLRVGAQLAQVRDRKLYAELGHADMESYAEARLQLGRASLYRYLQVYDWVSKFHPEWLQPKPKGFIPDLNDVADLIWIESELTNPDLDPKKKTALEDLKAKALTGTLRKGELEKLRRQSRARTEDDGLKSFLSKLRQLRMRGSQLAGMPPEVVTHLDAAIAILQNAQTVAHLRVVLPEKAEEKLLA